MPRRGAFTLVELLVVIGIIALLISILLPSLARARESANGVKCMSNQRQIGTAGMMFTGEHNGYLQPAGYVSNATPAGVNDNNQRKYAYFQLDNGDTKLVSLAVALAPYLGATEPLGTFAEIEAAQADPDGFVRVWDCASTAEQRAQVDLIADPADSPAGYHPAMPHCDFAVNESLLGKEAQRRLGRISTLPDASRFMLTADGLARGTRYIAAYYHLNMATGSAPVTFAEAHVQPADLYNTVGRAGHFNTFDHLRHSNRMNILYVDGHVSTSQIAASNNPDDYTASGQLEETILMSSKALPR